MLIPEEAVVEEAFRISEPACSVDWRYLLLDNGVERTWDDAVSRFGTRATQAAYIFRTIEESKLKPSAISIPPAIFLSYRHGSSEHDKWVRGFADELERRGYRVEYDRTERLRSSVEIAQLVGRIAACQRFVAIIDQGYIESVSHHELEPAKLTWAYVEWVIARGLVESFGVLLQTLVLAGAQPIDGGVLSDGHLPGTTFYVDTPDKLDRVLAALFPPLAPADASTIDAASALVMQSKMASFEGSHAEAFALAAQAATRLPHNSDTQVRLCLAAIAMAQRSRACEAARQAATLAPHMTFVRLTHIFAELFAGNFSEARILADEVAHLFADRWRMKFLQLGMEAAAGEPHAMESCVRAAARIAPVDLASWSIRWRHDALGIERDDLRLHEFPPARPLPISGRQTRRPESVVVMQKDKAREIGDSGISWVPRLIITEPDHGPDYLSDLNTLLLACAAASWIPGALRNRSWAYIERPEDARETATLLLKDGRMLQVSRP
jgi:TIR domain